MRSLCSPFRHFFFGTGVLTLAHPTVDEVPCGSGCFTGITGLHGALEAMKISE